MGDERKQLGLFQGVGLELEYMIVDAASLEVRPICDQVMAAQAGEAASEVEFADICWSNELVLHVLEFKTNGPTADIAAAGRAFAEHVRRANDVLEPLGGRLMPTAMHPWMDPDREMRLWPHAYNAVYEAFNRLFDCRGHGWANLQSMHINLPFANDAEFGRLHAAIRVILPLLPALAASSPFRDGAISGMLDTRLESYRNNARRIPSIAGRVIPEAIFTGADYQREILERIYADLAPHDPAGVLRHEWANARGAIARFTRGAIEIRVLDVQECPAADMAIAALVVAALRLMVEETWSPLADQQQWQVTALADVLDLTIRDAHLAVISDPNYLRLWGRDGGSCTAGELWQTIVEQVARHRPGDLAEAGPALETLMAHGPAAHRMVKALERMDLRSLARRLCECLAENQMLR